MEIFEKPSSLKPSVLVRICKPLEQSGVLPTLQLQGGLFLHGNQKTMFKPLPSVRKRLAPTGIAGRRIICVPHRGTRISADTVKARRNIHVPTETASVYITLPLTIDSQCVLNWHALSGPCKKVPWVWTSWVSHACTLYMYNNVLPSIPAA